MVLAASIQESKAEGPDGADQILPAKSANRSRVQGDHQLECLCAFTKDCCAMLSSTKTQTAGLKELSYIGLNISDIQVII